MKYLGKVACEWVESLGLGSVAVFLSSSKTQNSLVSFSAFGQSEIVDMMISEGHSSSEILSYKKI